MMFLMKINDKYAQVRTNVLMMQPLPTLNDAYRMCIEEEKHKELSQLAASDPVEGMVFAADKRRYNDKGSYGRPAYGFQPNSRMSGNKRNSHLVCEHCKKTGHAVAKCYELHGYP